MLSIDGKFLAHVDTKRMNWYLDRDLAFMLNDKDFQLTFISKGDKDRGEYYKLSLTNNCVICGTEENLTKHHVVPHQYRKYMPIEYKSKASFDVLCLCIKCHHEYEITADKFKIELLDKYDILDNNKNFQKVHRYHKTLNSVHAPRIPKEKKLAMIEFLEEFFKAPIEEILEVDGYEFETSTELLMKKVDDIENFVIMWRKHFIEYAKPKFLPKEWYDEMHIVFRI
jgi:hypothetical protein